MQFVYYWVMLFGSPLEFGECSVWLTSLHCLSDFNYLIDRFFIFIQITIVSCLVAEAPLHGFIDQS